MYPGRLRNFFLDGSVAGCWVRGRLEALGGVFGGWLVFRRLGADVDFLARRVLGAGSFHPWYTATA